jgi:hypothetical protein
MNLFFLFTDFYFKLFLHCNPKRSYFFVFCFIKTQPFVKRKPVKTGKKIQERSRFVLGRFYCIYMYIYLFILVKELCQTVIILTDTYDLINKHRDGPKQFH